MSHGFRRFFVLYVIALLFNWFSGFLLGGALLLLFSGWWLRRRWQRIGTPWVRRWGLWLYALCALPSLVVLSLVATEITWQLALRPRIEYACHDLSADAYRTFIAGKLLTPDIPPGAEGISVNHSDAIWSASFRLDSAAWQRARAAWQVDWRLAPVVDSTSGAETSDLGFPDHPPLASSGERYRWGNAANGAFLEAFRDAASGRCWATSSRW